MVIPILFPHSQIDIQIVDTFRLKWVMMLQTFMYKFLCELMFSGLLGIHLRLELLGCITLCLTFWGPAKVFSTAAILFYIYTRSVWGVQLSHIFFNTLVLFLVIAILVNVKWYCTMVLINDVEHLFMYITFGEMSI